MRFACCWNIFGSKIAENHSIRGQHSSRIYISRTSFDCGGTFYFQNIPTGTKGRGGSKEPPFPRPVVLTLLTSKCVSRHNGVQFLISHLPRWLAPAALASLLFDFPGPQNIGKTQCFAIFLPFHAAASSFF